MQMNGTVVSPGIAPSEVAGESLLSDRLVKARVCARAGIPAGRLE